MRTHDAAGALRSVELLGYPVVWIPEGLHLKEIFSHAGVLLAATDRIVVAAGIANIWARSATASASGAAVLGEAFPGRFVLGLGVSHTESMAPLGHDLARPLEAMEAYLGAMLAAGERLKMPRPSIDVPVLLAALGPQMLRLAASSSWGAHPYFVPVPHTRFARSVLGEGPFLAVEVGVVLESDPLLARSRARRYMRNPLSLGNYRRNLLRLGWAETELANDGSDLLVDGLVAWGDPASIARRVAEHLEAGANHVAVQVYGDDPGVFPLHELERLAPVLLSI